MDGRRRRQVRESFDLGLGFTGFFAVAFVAITFYLEVSGRDALWTAITGAALMLFEAILWMLRKRALSRLDGADGP
jgi:hypothetical protein